MAGCLNEPARVEIEPLLPEHAQRVFELACHYYQAALRPPLEELKQALRQAEEEQRHWSLGAWEGESLRGYLLAWVDETRAEDSDEEVLLIEDLLVDSGCLPQSLLERLVWELEQAGLASLPLESTLIPNQARLIDLCEQSLEQFGYQCVARDTMETNPDSPELIWQRFERNSS